MHSYLTIVLAVYCNYTIAIFFKRNSENSRNFSRFFPKVRKYNPAYPLWNYINHGP